MLTSSLLVSPGPPFPFHLPAGAQDVGRWPYSVPQLRMCLSNSGLDEPPLSTRLFFLLEAVNTGCPSRSIYLIIHPVNIYVACNGLGIPEQHG